MSGVLEQLRSVLDRDGLSDERFAMFSQEPEEPGGREMAISIDAERWKELGEPEQVTITIRPGDELNGPGPESFSPAELRLLRAALECYLIEGGPEMLGPEGTPLGFLEELDEKVRSALDPG